MISAITPVYSSGYLPLPSAKGADKDSDASASSATPPSSATPASSTASPSSIAPPSSVATSSELTEQDKAVVKQLQKTDQEVRAHEQAHKTAGGQYAGGASYTYSTGPDGKKYAVGGEVSIDIAPVEGDPQATIDKLAVVISAALAPAHPSSQDRKVAAQATAARNQASAELFAQKIEEKKLEQEEKSSPSSADNGSILPGIDAYHQGAGLGNPDTPSGISLNLFS